MSLTDARHPKNDIRYKNVALKDLPGSESLKDTVARFIPLWTEKIVPDLKRNKKVLIAAHGNSLRALIMNLEGLSPEEIMQVNVPTGIPISYELDESFKVISKKFLGDPEEVEKAIQSVANQGKKN